VLIDVVMPQIDGFQLAAMIREHPRFQKLAMIFVSGVQIAETDHLRGYEIGAVDYVTVPVVPEVLRAKVRVFIELFRKTRQLETLNAELEKRVAARTASWRRRPRSCARARSAARSPLSAGDMGSWEGRPHNRPHRMGRRPLSHLRRRSGYLPADASSASRR
jgi:DNA-binding response OmpR family regulator